MISVLFTQTLPSLMEITSEARAFCGSCFLRDAQGGCAPGVPGGPGLSLELDSSVLGSGTICSPRLFTRGSPGWNPGSAPTSSAGAASREAPCVPVSLLGLSNGTHNNRLRDRGIQQQALGLGAQGAPWACPLFRMPGGPHPRRRGPWPWNPASRRPPPPATRQPSPACGAVTSSQCYFLLQRVYSQIPGFLLV